MRQVFSCLLFTLVFASATGQTSYQKDFDYYLKTIKDNYAYFDRQQINWDRVKPLYQPLIDTCSSRNSFITIIEKTLNELYNGHNFLNTNTRASNRLVPSGSDIKVVYNDGKYMIGEVREQFNADLCGLKPGMQILAFNDREINTAVQKYLPRTTSTYVKGMYEYAANMLLAGTHDAKRKITIQENGTRADFYPDVIRNKTEQRDTTTLEWKTLANNIGYIRIHNSLGNDDLIKDFDFALDQLSGSAGLILDLRETPGGGTSTVARAIMGRFIDKELPYQKHLYVGEERETGIKRTTLELVSPRKTIFKKRLIILVGHWTGSMGEGMAIGFDAMKRGTVMGTQMAGLLGEIYTFETPELKVPFSFPCVQLQSVSGQPREDYLPTVQLKDPRTALTAAMKLLTAKQVK